MMQQRTTDGLEMSVHGQHFFILCYNSLICSNNKKEFNYHFMESIKLLYFFIYSNTEKEFKYQFMGSMAQLGTWDAVVDLGQGSKGTLSVICLFCFFS